MLTGPRMRFVWLLSGLIAAVFTLAGCGRGRGAVTQRVIAPPYRVDPAHPTRLLVRADLDRKIQTEVAGRGDVAAVLVGHGRLAFAPDASYALRVPFVSFVERVRAAVDDVVQPGQPLAELRSPDVARMRAELVNAQATLRAEEANATRLQRLVGDGTATERELTETRARLQSARASVVGLRSSLSAAGVTDGTGDRWTLRAPRSGRVLMRTLDPGERVTPDDSAPSFLVGDPERLVVRAAFPERDAVWLDDRMPCSFTVTAVGNARWEGTLSEVVRSVDRDTRTASATCTPHQWDRRLTAEMTAAVEVSVQGNGTVVVPRTAVLLRRDDRVLFVRLAPGVLERRRIELGLSLGDRVLVTSGLEAGESVVTSGAVLLDGELDPLL